MPKRATFVIRIYANACRGLLEELIGRSSCSVLAGPNCLPLFHCFISLSTPLSGSPSHFSLSGFVLAPAPSPAPSPSALPVSPNVALSFPAFLQPPAGPGFHDLSVERRLPMSQADKAANYPTLQTPGGEYEQTATHSQSNMDSLTCAHNIKKKKKIQISSLWII